jgi:excisionase family DNA binding protein
LTSRQAAELLGVALSTVQLWTENGVLSAWKTGGGHRRIARRSVEEVLRQQRAAAAGTGAGDRMPVIVVVEDQPELRKLYELQFEARELPFRTVVAGNGFEGLVQIGRWRPDIVITDLLMPGMDGFQMIRALKGMSGMKDVMTIVVSALSRGEIDARGGLADDLRLFHKPLDFDDLERVIRAHVPRARCSA